MIVVDLRKIVSNFVPPQPLPRHPRTLARSQLLLELHHHFFCSFWVIIHRQMIAGARRFRSDPLI